MIDDHQPEYDEPEGDWVTAPLLTSQPLVMLTLCRYSGDRFDNNAPVCPARGDTHPDVDCWEHFYSTAAILAGAVFDADEVDLTTTEVRMGLEEMGTAL